MDERTMEPNAPIGDGSDADGSTPLPTNDKVRGDDHDTNDESKLQEENENEQNNQGEKEVVATDKDMDDNKKGNEPTKNTPVQHRRMMSEGQQKTTTTTKTTDAVTALSHCAQREEEECCQDNSLDTIATASYLQRLAMFVARNPKMCFWSALIISIALAVFGLIHGEFSMEASSYGWTTRGTTISDRESQSMLVRLYKEYMFSGGEAAWKDLTENLQVTWEDSDFHDERRRLSHATTTATGNNDVALFSIEQPEEDSTFIIPPNLGTSASRRHSSLQTTDESKRHLPFCITDEFQRRMQNEEVSATSTLHGCDTSFYTSPDFTKSSRLWPIWKLQKKEITVDSSSIPEQQTGGKVKLSIASPEVVHDICVAEENTQRLLQEKGLCLNCNDDSSTTCLPPYSIVLLIRMLMPNSFDHSCTELRDVWESYHEEFENQIQQCLADLKATVFKSNHTASNSSNKNNNGEQLSASTSSYELPMSCPEYFSPALVDANADEEGIVTYSSSVFVTDDDDIEELFQHVHQFDRGSNLVKGAYDTQDQDFSLLFGNEALSSDATLGMASAIVVVVAIMTHTRSPCITLVGLLQIMLSFPLAFLVYRVIAGLEFFPYLNFMGIFIVFALGADDIFVAVDKWKNARLEYGSTVSTQLIAAVALPDALQAMFLTTLTTSIAFFSTAICPVAPVRMFAVFCGLLVILDYIMCIALVFPCLCIYDIHLQNTKRQGRNRPNCFMSLQRNYDTNTDVDTKVDRPTPQDSHLHENDLEAAKPESKNGQHQTQQRKPNLIQRLLATYYETLHQFRWLLLFLCLAALTVCAYFSTNMALPDTLHVRLLDESVQSEANYKWRQQMLDTTLAKAAGSTGFVLWGVSPADTGNKNNPKSFSSLVLDETFDPSSEEAQTFLLKFCDDLFAQEFASPTSAGYLCPIQSFDLWLKTQQQLKQQDQQQQLADATSAAEINNSTSSASNITSAVDSRWIESCGGASQVPVAQDYFHPCMTAYAQSLGDTRVLSQNGRVTIMFFHFGVRISFKDDYRTLKDEFWLIERWMQANFNDENTPPGVRNGFFNAGDFWWYDTTSHLVNTAFGSATITLIASALVILFSSRSFVLTLFASLSIIYVLTSATATMVAFGWQLGFMESICFAILIGLSADFVTHFSHAYASFRYGNDADRGQRTKFAIVHMGPSILAAAATSVAGAIMMFFCIIAFFEKFAFILFFSIVQATIAAFVFYCTLTDCFGPSNPTKLVDSLTNRIFRHRNGNKQDIVDKTKDDIFDDMKMKNRRREANLTSASALRRVQEPMSVTEFACPSESMTLDDNPFGSLRPSIRTG